MKLLIINGSLRGGRGATALLAAKIAAGATGVGAHCVTAALADIRIDPCTGCRVCQRRDHYLACVRSGQDDFDSLLTKVREADFILFATPIYVFGMSSLLRVFFERLTSTSDSSKPVLSEKGLFFHHTDATIFRKPFALLTCQDNIENETAENATGWFKTYSRFCDAHFAGALTVKAAGRMLRHQDSVAAGRLFHALERAGRELATKKRLSLSVRMAVSRSMDSVPAPVRLLVKIPFLRKTEKFRAGLLAKMEEMMAK